MIISNPVPKLCDEFIELDGYQYLCIERGELHQIHEALDVVVRGHPDQEVYQRAINEVIELRDYFEELAYSTAKAHSIKVE